MLKNEFDILDLLDNIDPSSLNYTEWVNVGMALHHEGYSANDWENWSSKDSSRYVPGECYKKWSSFQGNASPVTAGTLVQLAKDQGWTPVFNSSVDSKALDWDDVIGSTDDLVIIDKNWVEGKEISEPKVWNPAKQIIQYLETLYEASECVGYVTETYKTDKGKYVPAKKGAYDRTAGQLIEQLTKCNGDIGSVFGDYNKEAGAWIRFNPLDGKGVTNDNVTEFRYALVESDSMDLEKQNAIIRELELPVACLLYSGGKSIHAIVRVDATNKEEYRKRVDYLYNVCNKNGLEIDNQNRNPSRLSRLPGVMRDGKKQYIIDTSIGKKNYEEWFEWIEGVNDDLPDPESLNDFWGNLPKLSDPLIEGILRQGHKMLMAGPSKAGKSFALIELCIAIAEGKKWLNWNCTKGRILYVNLELDRASCLHRFKDVYNALGIEPNNLKNIDIWNLRGKSLPMDKLAPKLIRRAAKKGYIGIVIDPIYKIITGDENSADQMAHFTNQFDKVCTELGCSVIYCHHHSKGNQGNKRSMDRASGSGVFARDPDALIDLVELEISESLLALESNKMECRIRIETIKKYDPNYEYYEIGQDDRLSVYEMKRHCDNALTQTQKRELNEEISKINSIVSSRSAWRIEGTLREFPKFNPIDLWFDYPIHKVDSDGVLKDIDPEGIYGSKTSQEKGREANKKKGEITRNKLKEVIDTLINFGGQPTITEVINYFKDEHGEDTKGVSLKSVKNFINNSEEYELFSVEGERAKRIRTVED